MHERLSLAKHGTIPKGFEIEAEFLPPGTQGLRLRGSVQHNVARYGDFMVACYAGQTQADGCNRVGPPPNNTPLQDRSGKPLIDAPRWTGTVGFDHDPRSGAVWCSASRPM